MNRQYGDSHYTTRMIEDRAEGFVGYELMRQRQGSDDCIARILFWDSSGQFSLETLGGDVPLDILEELVGEAKSSIKFA
ncbi:hypothetical protein [Aquisphaera insulae]|uniref:hypothetical protein n=1 Tax=Aquisphaera insulae TaxID=2712864 RepID=UPI00196B9DA8|nr:hypothetical protein [Aquisphaera insulae]